MFLFSKSPAQRHRIPKECKSAESCVWFAKRLGYCITLLMLVSFLFIGCQEDEEIHADTGFVPVGEWISYDSYSIKKDFVNYFMAGSEYAGVTYPDTILKGSIEKAVDFSKDSGVLIIKITEATYNTTGKFTGIYYSEYDISSIKMATAYADGSVEADTLTAALSLFTVDNVGNHVSMWGTYTK